MGELSEIASMRSRPLVEAVAGGSEVGWPFHFNRGNDSEDVDLFVS
jgi:hypothetical protein